MDARRIALIKPSALGDIVHALPVLTALRIGSPPRHHLGRQLRLRIADPEPSRPHRHAPLRPRRIQEGPAPSARYALSFAARTAPPRFDLVIDLQGLLRTGLMCLATRARVRVGFANAREGSRYAYTHASAFPTRSASTPSIATGAWPRLSARAMCPKRFHVPLDPSGGGRGRDELAGLPRPWIAVAVGAKWVTKRWPPAHFAELLNRAWVRARRDVLLRRHGRGHRRCRAK